MSKNKSGIKIVETDDKLFIRAGESFAEKSSVTKEILQRLELDSIKKVSILLSPKSKNFQDTFFLIRSKIIKEKLENAQILLTSQSGHCFKQRVDADDTLSITTRAYSLRSNPDKGILSVQMTRGGKVFANEDIAKEICSVMSLEKPEKVQIIFVRAENEKHEDYIKRIRNLENYFLRKAVELYSIKQLEFLIGTKDKPMLISSYERAEASLALICTEQKQMPVKINKHDGKINETICYGQGRVIC